MGRMRRVAKAATPPVIWSLACRLRGQKGVVFQGDYHSWEAAEQAAEGYDTPAIFERVREAALKVKRGEAVFERDSVCFYHEEYRWPTLACLLRVAAEQGGKLRVLDFGGSLGSFYFQHRKHFVGLREVRWAVVEQPHFVQCGNKEFANDVLAFYETIEDCVSAGRIDVIFLSSVLQYLPEPYGWLRIFSETGIPYLLLDRTPFIDQNRDRLTVQHVPPEIYPASYPAWFFSRKMFAEAVEKSGYREVARFEALDNIGAGGYEGVLFTNVKSEKSRK